MYVFIRMNGGSGWVVEIHKTCETELFAGFPDITLAATLHNLEDFFTLFSFYSRIFICIVVTFLLLLQVLDIFFTHINFAKLPIYSGGREILYTYCIGWETREYQLK
jgi:hypothetical protein